MSVALKRLPAHFYRLASGREPVREWLKALATSRSRSGAQAQQARHMKKTHVGSSVDSWLRKEGIYEQTTSRAIKRVLARQLQAAMHTQNVSKVEMARRMGSSRSALDRLLDPDNDAVTLGTLRKAAAAVGLQLRLELV